VFEEKDSAIITSHTLVGTKQDFMASLKSNEDKKPDEEKK